MFHFMYLDRTLQTFKSSHGEYKSILKHQKKWKLFLQICIPCNDQTLLKRNVKLNLRSCLTIDSFAAAWPYYLGLTWVLIHTFLHKMLKISQIGRERRSVFSALGLGWPFNQADMRPGYTHTHSTDWDSYRQIILHSTTLQQFCMI